MDNKTILAEVICPAVSKTYDFIIDSTLTVGEAVERIADEIRRAERIDILFSEIESVSLFSSEYRYPLNAAMKICDCGIMSGSRLMLV